MTGVQIERRFERVAFFACVRVVSTSGNVPLEARSFDISLGGAGLICPRSLPIGASVALTFRLPSRAGEVSEQVHGRVAHLRFDDGSAIMGIEFIPALDRRNTPVLVQAIERL